MGRRKGRRRPTRREKMAAGGRVVAVGIKKKGQAEIIKPDFDSISPSSRKIFVNIARCLGRNPQEYYSEVD